MSDISSIEASIDPFNKLTFLLDWELTLKCNQDCSYCGTGHDNATKHPNLKECIDTIDFMYSYADLQMQTKLNSLKYVVLNVYGGEALFHPQIEDILKTAKEKHKKYADQWKLIISSTTNLSITKNKLLKIIDYLDEITCSYHAEASDKQKNDFKQNLLLLKKFNKSVKVIIIMHNEQKLFNECVEMINWCNKNNIRHLPRQIDHDMDHAQAIEFFYSTNQKNWFNELYNNRSKNAKVILLKKTDCNTNKSNLTNLAEIGRSCCGGRLLSTNQDYKSHVSYLSNKLKGWSCSVSHFFLFVKQTTREVFNNKDCKTNFNNELGPIGTLDDTDKILFDAKTFISNKEKSKITCIKEKCVCGLCAPKAETPELYDKIMKKYFV